MGAVDLRLLPGYAPALLTIELPDPAGPGGARTAALLLRLIVQLSDALQYAWSQLPNKHLIVPTINATRPGRGSWADDERRADRGGAVVGHPLPAPRGGWPRAWPR